MIVSSADDLCGRTRIVRSVKAVAFSAALAFSTAGTAGASADKTGDPRAGERAYAQCLSCHALQRNVVGPKHCGVVGRRAGSVAGFDYSPAMRASNITWTAETLDRFLADPMKAIPGTSMIYAGIADAKQRADLIAWLRQADASSACR